MIVSVLVLLSDYFTVSFGGSINTSRIFSMVPKHVLILYSASFGTVPKFEAATAGVYLLIHCKLKQHQNVVSNFQMPETPT